MTWEDVDWPTLDRLRQRFLSAPAAGASYWETADDLANYDFTYGERIGWKWDHVLRELRLRRWHPRSRTVLDWGCGSGIASRRVISFFGADHFDSLILWDQSGLACDFAADAAQREFPKLDIVQATPGYLAGAERIGLLVISHVLNELPPETLEELRMLAVRAEAILWTEAGTHDVSRQLGEMRERLRGAGFRVIAPCTHENECPMFALGRERDWCHCFAPPPAGIHADSDWVKFGHRVGIDLRSLPYAFLALDRNPGDPAAGASRVIGRPEFFKPYARWLNCDAAGLAELELPKRPNSALFKELERSKAPLVYRWQREGNRVIGGEALGAESNAES